MPINDKRINDKLIDGYKTMKQLKVHRLSPAGTTTGGHYVFLSREGDRYIAEKKEGSDQFRILYLNKHRSRSFMNLF